MRETERLREVERERRRETESESGEGKRAESVRESDVCPNRFYLSNVFVSYLLRFLHTIKKITFDCYRLGK